MRRAWFGGGGVGEVAGAVDADEARAHEDEFEDLVAQFLGEGLD